jgi:cell wall-associated NlpC family hydrolase
VPPLFSALRALALVVTLLTTAFAVPTAAQGATGGADPKNDKLRERVTGPQIRAAAVPGNTATVDRHGMAHPPASAPQAVKEAIWAGNRIQDKPYKWGGGHGRWKDSGYDCSGTVSYVLHKAGLLNTPLVSGAFARWGKGGKGRWISIYAHGGHAYVILAGLRLDTSGNGERGPRWREEPRSPRGFAVRHPRGL